MTTTLVGKDGRVVPLGREIGRGGEGTILEVAGRPNLVAKVYHRLADAERSAKLRAMADLCDDQVLRVAAWPVDTLHPQPGGPVAGLLIPMITDHKQIHSLYGPKTRLREFPTANWQFLVHAAVNLARAFAVIHEHGHVIGDVNHANAMVSKEATISLIDCDSFQIAANGRCYYCDVGMLTHQPPEFQDLASFRRVPRTPNHDNFGLAVLIFQLLMMGRHPFAGRYLGSGDMPIERAIKELRFAYGGLATAKQMQPPPNTLVLTALSTPIFSLFERAFSPDGMRDGARPKAAEWVSTLEILSKHLQKCGSNPAHIFFAGLAQCPWCELENGSGIVFFIAANIKRRGSAFDLSAVWTEIVAVAPPSPAPPLPHFKSVKVKPSGKARRTGWKRRLRIALGTVIGVLAIVGCFAGVPLRGGDAFWTLVVGAIVALWVGITNYEYRAETRRAVEGARQLWGTLSQRWQVEAGDVLFKQKRYQLEESRNTLLALPARCERMLQQLAAKQRERQLYWFLEPHRLVPGRIKGIGVGRISALNSYGIETAADLTEGALSRIPGFGPRLISDMLAWRSDIECRFVFNPARGMDQRDIDELDQEQRNIENKMVQILTGGATELKRLANDALFKRHALRSEIDVALAKLAKCECEWRST